VDGISVGAGIVVAVLAVQPFGDKLLWESSPLQLLTYGAASYAAAIVAAVLFGVVSRLPEGLLRRALSSAVFPLLFLPSLDGSFYIGIAVENLAGWRADVRVFTALYLLLWAVVSFLVLVVLRAVTRRATVRR
jgi:hypothetical protein